MARPRLLDLFCCAGGASVGYHRAGFDVVGVDIAPQPHYPYEFVQADAVTLLGTLIALAGPRHPDFDMADLGERAPRWPMWSFDAIHASPPCQAFTACQRIQGNEHPDLVDATRSLLDVSGLPYVIENVPGAPLHDPVLLCGAMFPELNVYRHRLFETSFPVVVPDHPTHVERQTKMGRPPRDGERIQVVGNFSGVAKAREAMDMPWATRDELREAIPPAYAEHIGRQLIQHV